MAESSAEKLSQKAITVGIRILTAYTFLLEPPVHCSITGRWRAISNCEIEASNNVRM
jgi:hypothetical protein